MIVIIPAAAAERTRLWLSPKARQYLGVTPDVGNFDCTGYYAT